MGGFLPVNDMPNRKEPPIHDETNLAGISHPIVRVANPRAVWRVRADWRDRLLGRQAPDWLNLEDDPRANCVKVGHRRKTWRVSPGDGMVFAKVVELHRWADFLKHWVFGTAVDREWRASRRAEAVGIQVVRCLGLVAGRARPLRIALLTEGLDDAASLTDAWARYVAHGPPGEQRSCATAIMNSVSTLVASAHERGFVHGDEHPNNILLARTERPPGFKAFYVDVHASRITSRPTSIRRTVDSLAQLNQYFHRVATRTQRLRFFKRYLQERPSLQQSGDVPAVQRELLARLARAAENRAKYLARHRDRRIGREGKYFKTLAIGEGWTVTVIQALERRHVFPEAHVPDRTEKEWRAILEPIVRWAKPYVRNEIIDHGGLHVQLGEPLGYIRRVTAVVLKTPQWHEFERCHQMRHRDVYADLILAYGEHRSHGLIDHTMLLRPKPAALQGVSRDAQRKESS